jgi:phospholipase/carboxylesterase
VPRVGYPDVPTFTSSYREASDWLDSLPYEQIVLGGFSQGCVMALALGLGQDRPRPVAIAGFSGFIPEVEGWQLDTSRPLPPVALGHGTADPVISVEFGRSARDRLLAAGAELLYREYPLPHTLDPQFLDEVRSWLATKSSNQNEG